MVMSSMARRTMGLALSSQVPVRLGTSQNSLELRRYDARNGSQQDPGLRRTEPLGHVTQLQYDTKGNVTSRRGAAGAA
jgi:YD repeat-containing protein